MAVSAKEILVGNRRQRRRRLKIWLYGFFLAAYLIVFGSAYLILRTPLFRVREFKLSESREGTAEAIKKTVADHLIKNWAAAKFLPSDNLLFWKPAALSNFDKPLFLAGLKLERDFLNRRVNLEFTRRRPFGVWCRASGGAAGAASGFQLLASSSSFSDFSYQQENNCQWFDETGTLFAPAPMVEGFLIPKIISVGHQPLQLNREIMNLLGLADSLPFFRVAEIFIKSGDLREAEIKTVRGPSPPQGGFGLASGPKFYLSLKNPPENLEEILKKLKLKEKLENLQYIDLRVPGRVYYQYK